MATCKKCGACQECGSTPPVPQVIYIYPGPYWQPTSYPKVSYGSSSASGTYTNGGLNG